MRLRVAAVALAAAVAVTACGATGPAEHSATTPTYSVTLTVDRPVVSSSGVALVRVTERGAGAAVADRAVRVSPVMVHMGHAVPSLRAAPTDRPGEYRATGELFFMSGVWEVDVDVSDAARTETATFRVLVADR